MKHILITALVLIAILFATHDVFAHVLKTDGSIGAVLHVDPDDDPIAQETTYFFFEFKDKKNLFKPELCNCVVTVIKDTEVLHSESLFEDTAVDSGSSSFSYVFPEKNIYQIQVVGKPKTPNAFAPFTLVYDVRVAKISEKPDTMQSKKNYSMYALLFIVPFIGILILSKLINDKKKKN